MLHSRLLQYIDEVARLGSIRAAGARLHVAPSAINRQILLLEAELEQRLFERLPRGMRPTPAGEALLAHIRGTLRQYRETVADIRDLQALGSGEVVIATMTGLASGVVATAAASFRTRHPQVRISIRTMSSLDILHAVENSEADLGLGFNISASTQVEVCWQMNTRLGVVVSPHHPLVQMDTIPLAQCAPYPLIFADRSMVIHGIVAEAFAHAEIDIQPAFHTNSIETMKRLAISGEAIAFLSEFDIAEELRDGRLAFRPVRDAFSNNIVSLVRREKHGHGLAGFLLADEIVAALRPGGPPALQMGAGSSVTS
ncbi:LysR family transcriptional regulator [Nocardia goodfellowii]|uniref:DNA-binding transcriptional LysR family regulator n=1 Tax=Nocardia goodfellowii TaxID=882446 RepID=A0ABS4QNK3_9NOCA|nr:LysR family transcriptional regulator [Nocardia goodfellowii]MBP2192594.1 DNA-binding transcriptional LysR family regulator [Nocardia goodfellowii]